MDFRNAYESIDEFSYSVVQFLNIARRNEVTSSGDSRSVFLNEVRPELLGEAKTNILGVSFPAEKPLGEAFADYHLDCRSGGSK